MKDKVLVIGSNSFSGANFVDSLLGAGFEVVGISRSPEPNAVFLPYKWSGCENFKFQQFDLNLHLDQIMQVVHTFRPAFVVNFSAQSMVAQSWEKPEDWFETNLVSTVKLHNQLRNCDFLEKYVHISTPEVYGSCHGDVSEDHAFNPSTPYAVSRAACDMSLLSFFNAYNFPVVFTRAANVYGAGQQLYRIIPRTVLKIKMGHKLKLHGGGESVRSFIHIRDVCAGTLQAMRQGELGHAYHFATSCVLSIRDLVKKICDQMHASFDMHVEMATERLGKDTAYLLDSTKARQTLGWTDTINLEQGIEETIAWVNDNFVELQKQPLEYIHKK